MSEQDVGPDTYLVAIIRRITEGLRSGDLTAETDPEAIEVLRQLLPKLNEILGPPEGPVLVDCPYCHGAHYTGQRCPLSPP